MTIQRNRTKDGRERLHFTPNDYEPDRRIRGAAEIYTRARRWGHLPARLTFQTFLALITLGQEPFIN